VARELTRSLAPSVAELTGFPSLQPAFSLSSFTDQRIVRNRSRVSATNDSGRKKIDTDKMTIDFVTDPDLFARFISQVCGIFHNRFFLFTDRNLKQRFSLPARSFRTWILRNASCTSNCGLLPNEGEQNGSLIPARAKIRQGAKR